MHAFEVFLGGKHTGSDAEFLQTMRHYMPAKHRDFLEVLTHQPSMREYVKQSKDTIKLHCMVLDPPPHTLVLHAGKACRPLDPA